MIRLALFACVVVCVNALYAVAGLVAAKRYDIEITLGSDAGLAVLVTGTIVEWAAIALQLHAPSPVMFIPAFGAVVVGAACDAACGYVFDAITLPALAAMWMIAAFGHSLEPFAFGAAVSGGALGLLYAVTRGRGLGLGDVKLACCIGGAAGVAGGLEALGVAFVLGGAYAAYLLMAKRARRGDELRFAPYLAAGMAAVVLYGTLP